jgi:replication factor C small subunit
MVVGLAKPEDVQEMLELSFKGNFTEARKKLRLMLMEYGLSGLDILKQVHSEIFKLNLPDEEKLKLADLIGEVDYRLSQGADEEIQLSAMLAKLALYAFNKGSLS